MLLGLRNIPTEVALWHRNAKVVTGNAMQRDVASGQRHEEQAYQNTPANGDVNEHYFLLRKGTYTIEWLGIKANNRGIVDWLIDGVAIGGSGTGQDWYIAGAGTVNQPFSATLTVTYSGWHTLKMQVAGKNASSSSYFVLITCIDVHV